MTMDNKLSGNKLAGLRTFAKDQENKNSKATTTSTHVEVIKNPEIKEQKKATLSEHDFKIHHPVKEVDEIHENIKTEIVTKTIPPPPPPTVVAKKADKKITISTNNEDADSATIITDTKKDRFKFFPAISESIKNWIEKIREDRQAKKAPKYTVPETTRRKGVIQKATSLTGKITSSDHDTIQERIRQRQAIEHEKNDGNDNITWTPNTEPGYLLLEKESSQISNVQVEQRKSFFTTQQDIVVKNLGSLKSIKSDSGVHASEKDSASRWENEKLDDEVIIPEPISKTIIISEPEILPVPSLEKISPIITETVTKQSGFESSSEKTVVPETIKIPTPPVIVTQSIPLPLVKEVEPEILNETHKEIEEELSNQDKGFLLSKNTNVLAFSIFGIILVILVIIGISYFWSNNHEVEKVPTMTDYPKVINGDIDFVYQPITNKYDFVSRITSEFGKTNSEVSQFVFITTPEGHDAIKPSALLTHLGVKLNANFSQSITNLYFGQLHHINPFISFTVTDTDTAKGGMLVWEQNMRSEIYPILGLPTLESSTSTSKKFIDAMISGVDVRVLKGNNGEEEIIYGFTDSHTIIITNNSGSFGELLQLTK